MGMNGLIGMQQMGRVKARMGEVVSIYSEIQ